MRHRQRATNVLTSAAIIAFTYLVFWLAIDARAQDDPIICVPDQPCIAPAATAVNTPTATPVMAPSPEATPIIGRPIQLGVCKIAPGCVLLPLVVTP